VHWWFACMCTCLKVSDLAVSFELPLVWAGNWTQVLWKSTHLFSLSTLFLLLLVCLFVFKQEREAEHKGFYGYRICRVILLCVLATVHVWVRGQLQWLILSFNHGLQGSNSGHQAPTFLCWVTCLLWQILTLPAPEQACHMTRYRRAV